MEVRMSTEKIKFGTKLPKPLIDRLHRWALEREQTIEELVTTVLDDHVPQSRIVMLRSRMDRSTSE
jgi:hypothetical protein